MLPLPEVVPGLQEALVPGEKKFNLGYENKAPFGFSRSVDAMGFVAMDLGGNVALSLPLLPPSAPHTGDRFTRASSGLQVEARATEKNGTLSHHPQWGLLGSDTPRGGEVKGQPSRQWRQKRGLCGGRISPAAPLPCLVTPWGHRQAGGHTPAGSTSRQKLLR